MNTNCENTKVIAELFRNRKALLEFWSEISFISYSQHKLHFLDFCMYIIMCCDKNWCMYIHASSEK